MTEKKLIYDNANALEIHKCPSCGFKHTHKFQFDKGKFWVGKAGNIFIAWAYYMLNQSIALFTPLVNEKYTSLILWISAAVTVIFMIPGAVSKAVREIKTEIKIGGSL